MPPETSKPVEGYPGCDTLLAKWAEERGMSLWDVAKKSGLRWETVELVGTGRRMPSLIVAYHLERVTKGGVPVASWLGTELGQQLWAEAGTVFQAVLADEKHSRSQPGPRSSIRARWNAWYAKPENKERVKAQRAAAKAKKEGAPHNEG